MKFKKIIMRSVSFHKNKNNAIKSASKLRKKGVQYIDIKKRKPSSYKPKMKYVIMIGGKKPKNY